MKLCEKCGASIEENAKFCSICGAPQAENAVQTAPVPEENTMSADAPQDTLSPEAQENVKKLGRMRESLASGPYISAGLVVFSVFMPWLSLGRMFDVTIMDISKGLMLAIIFVAAASAHAIFKRRNYVLSVAMGHALLIFAVVAFIRYQSMLSEMEKTIFGAMAGSAISLEWGALCFFVGAVCLCVESVVLYTVEQLLSQGGALTGEVIVRMWKELACARVKLASIEVPAWTYSLVIGVLLVMLFSQSGMNRMMH